MGNLILQIIFGRTRVHSTKYSLCEKVRLIRHHYWVGGSWSLLFDQETVWQKKKKIKKSLYSLWYDFGIIQLLGLPDAIKID